MRFFPNMNRQAQVFAVERKIYDGIKPQFTNGNLVDVMEAFAGRAEVSYLAPRYNLRASQPFDLRFGQNLLEPQEQRALRKAQQLLRPLVFLAGVKCTSWSIFNENLNYVHGLAVCP